MTAFEEVLGGARGERQLEIAVPPAPPIRCWPPDAEHTFDSFVVGVSNTEAYAAARTLAEGASGPLFLCGPSGVGKTHLLHALFHAVAARGAAPACLPAARLMEALVQAYQDRNPDGFWRDLRGCDALLLDDAHSLAGRPETQERLVAGLVDWVEGGRVLVLTSDRPTDMPELLARLCARSVHAVVARIDPPEPALGLAILERMARARGVDLDLGLAECLTREFGGNIRRLQGALTRLLAYAQLRGAPPDESLAAAVLHELGPRSTMRPSVERILEVTAAAFVAPLRALGGRDRAPELVLPRHVAMYLARKLLQRPFGELGQLFGREHTTVLHAWRGITTRLEKDQQLAGVVERIEQRLAEGR
jgi:chromosomal replication initiator protein